MDLRVINPDIDISEAIIRNREIEKHPAAS